MQTPSSSSSSGSESDFDDDMVVKLKDIRTLLQLYKGDILRPAKTQKYKANPLLLEKIALIQGDITKLEVDCIVNAANRSLLGGGGVDGAIHAAAGRELLDECETLGGAETGESKITKGYKLPAKHIIHTVGPVYSRSHVEQSAELLTSCYKGSLELAVANSLKHIAFPSVSTGVYGYPIEDATHVALDTVRIFSESEAGEKLDRIIFVVWSNKDLGVYQALLPEYFPLEDKEPAPVDAKDSGETTDTTEAVKDKPADDPSPPEQGEKSQPDHPATT